MFKHSIPLSFIIGGVTFFAGILCLTILIEERLGYNLDGGLSVFLSRAWRTQHIILAFTSLFFLIFGILLSAGSNNARKVFVTILSITTISTLAYQIYDILDYRKWTEFVGLTIIFLIPQLTLIFLLTQKKVVQEFKGESDYDNREDLLDF